MWACVGIFVRRSRAQGMRGARGEKLNDFAGKICKFRDALLAYVLYNFCFIIKWNILEVLKADQARIIIYFLKGSEVLFS